MRTCLSGCVTKKQPDVNFSSWIHADFRPTFQNFNGQSLTGSALGLANLGNDSRGTRRDVAGSITPSASVRHKQRVAAKKANINGVDIADLATTVE